MSKRIVIDCRMWNESGVGRYIRNLVFNLQEQDSENEYFLILLKKDFDNLEFSNQSRLPRRFAPRNDAGGNFHKVLGDFKWYGIEEQIKLPKLLTSLKPDLVHFPHFNVPVLYNGKFIVTIHDLIHQKFKMLRATTHDPIIYQLKQLGYNKVFEVALKKSQKIITVSDYVKQELIQSWKVDEGKISVTKEGVEKQLLNISKQITQKEIDETLQKFKISKPFIFYVGNAHPHKNLEGLIETFRSVILGSKVTPESVSSGSWTSQDDTKLQLVLAGNDHYFWQKIKQKYTNENIVYTGFVTERELVTLYKKAKVYVVPSFEEGFGIPILEAFALGCPVVSSNRASLPEVGGEAVLYFDPQNQDDMAEKIMSVINNKELAEDLINKGHNRVKLFSWEKLTKKTLDIYKEELK